MNVVWKIRIHELVLTSDFKTITVSDQKAIFKNIRKKLSLAPKSYGKPLSGELKGYWRLRVGDYRVIYKIKEDRVEVLVIKVGIRRDDKVYKDLLYRLRRLQNDDYFQ